MLLNMLKKIADESGRPYMFSESKLTRWDFDTCEPTRDALKKEKKEEEDEEENHEKEKHEEEQGNAQMTRRTPYKHRNERKETQPEKTEEKNKKQQEKEQESGEETIHHEATEKKDEEKKEEEEEEEFKKKDLTNMENEKRGEKEKHEKKKEEENYFSEIQTTAEQIEWCNDNYFTGYERELAVLRCLQREKPYVPSLDIADKFRVGDSQPTEDTLVKLSVAVQGRGFPNAPYSPRVYYINAALLEPMHTRQWQDSRVAYISAAAPTPGSSDDFWRLIYERRVPLVVVLASEHEPHDARDPHSCFERRFHNYWPEFARDDGVSRVYGHVQVQRLPLPYAKVVTHPRKDTTSKIVHTKREWELRYFKLTSDADTNTETQEEAKKNKKIEYIHYVRMMHYTGWPSHGRAPTNESDFYDFFTEYRRLRQIPLDKKKNSTPTTILVHCTSGAGRTCAFIAADILTDYVESNATLGVPLSSLPLDMFELARYLRRHRPDAFDNIGYYSWVVEFIAQHYRYVLSSSSFSSSSSLRASSSFSSSSSSSPSSSSSFSFSSSSSSSSFSFSSSASSSSSSFP